MADLLVDTDAFIDHLRGVERLPRRRSRLAYSIVTRAELFSGPEHQLPAVRRLLGSLDEIPLDRRIAERAGEIRRSVGIRLPDALIAATALTHGLALRTRAIATISDEFLPCGCVDDVTLRPGSTGARAASGGARALRLLGRCRDSSRLYG